MLFALAQMKEGSACDHSSIVGTKLDGWIAETNSEWQQFLFQTGAQTYIGRNTTSEHYLFHMIFLGSETGFYRQHIYDSFLKTRCQQRHIGRSFLSRLRSHTGILAYLFAFVSTASLLILCCTLREMQHS